MQIWDKNKTNVLVFRVKRKSGHPFFGLMPSVQTHTHTHALAHTHKLTHSSPKPQSLASVRRAGWLKKCFVCASLYPRQRVVKDQHATLLSSHTFGVCVGRVGWGGV